MQMCEIQTGLDAIDRLSHGECVFKRSEHGGFAHGLRTQGHRIAGLAELVDAALQARNRDLEHFRGVVLEV